MKITKYGHACLFVEHEGQRIVTCPGEFTELPEDLSNITAVVITHPHGDHLNVANLQKIMRSNPDIELFGEQETIDGCVDLDVKKTVISKDSVTTIAGLDVAFYYGDHAAIYGASPCKNIGVRFGDELYYPGDSLRVIEDPVRIVAVPVSAPWLKASEYIDFIRAMNPEVAFPTHNGLLNEAGHSTMNNWLKMGTEDTDIEVRLVKNGEAV